MFITRYYFFYSKFIIYEVRVHLFCWLFQVSMNLLFTTSEWELEYYQKAIVQVTLRVTESLRLGKLQKTCVTQYLQKNLIHLKMFLYI